VTVNVLLLHGPNLNLLGERKPEVYGTMTLAQLNAELRKTASKLRLRLRIFQSNHEGELIDLLHRQRRWMDGLVINPGAYTHYSYALRDAIESVEVPAFEVHLSNIHAREPWRRVSVLSDVVKRQIVGKGIDSYREALQLLAKPAPR
jgi:3-dehydroquinate dehydratase-2